MEYKEFLELAKENISNLSHVGEGSFETYKEDVERFKIEHADIINQYGITESELFVMFMMLKKNYSDVQTQFLDPSKANKFTKSCANIFDSLLSKLPRTKASILYRGDKYQCIENFENRETYIFNSYLTASTKSSVFDNMSHGIKFIIKTRLIGESKAHEVFQICNVNDEYQVNFERGTKFQIDSIEKTNGIITITEL